ncbi:MAG: VanZ family protein [Rhodopseudomonas palustris]|uniref:VanZ family protein n=1 Tax=Rhodopseudomonas palustris TaxID=1076 RepID=A0A933RXT3_RHOPL|nr:VanZ family protein [Rhodopseudomonas palustris]
MLNLNVLLRALAVLAPIILVILTIVPAAERPVTVLPHDLEHFAAFCLTGLIYGFVFARRLGLLLVLAVGFAAVIEVLQIPLATRHARWEDLLVDSAALCLGVLLGRLARTVAPRPASLPE